mmetsp:Transcript_28249/g.63907  ORF Transcript_28249/g.63907 Transcript_28249/m.63907 type:complete len:155 (-) Transcript_28249:860-1324(-)
MAVMVVARGLSIRSAKFSMARSFGVLLPLRDRVGLELTDLLFGLMADELAVGDVGDVGDAGNVDDVGDAGSVKSAESPPLASGVTEFLENAVVPRRTQRCNVERRPLMARSGKAVSAEVPAGSGVPARGLTSTRSPETSEVRAPFERTGASCSP